MMQTAIFDLFMAVALAAHLMAADVAMGAPWASATLVWLARRRGESFPARVARSVAGWSLIALGLTLVLGTLLLAGLWCMGDERYLRVVASIPALRWAFFAGELLFSLILLGVYRLCWGRLEKRPLLHGWLAALAATNLMYHFPPVLAAISAAAARTELAHLPFNKTLSWQLRLDPEVVSQVLHVWLAALAAAGMTTMLVAARIGSSSDDQTRRWVAWGARWALLPTLFQLLAGAWVFFQLPILARDALLGGDLVATTLMAAGLAAALSLMHLLMSVALGDDSWRQARRAACAFALCVLFMAGTLHRVQRLNRTPAAPSFPAEEAEQPGR